MWKTAKLGELLEIARGGSPRPIKSFITDDDDGVNWIKIGDTEQGGKFIHSTKEKIKPSGISRSRYVSAGDFLLSNSMSFGRPYILQIDGCIHDGWLVLSNYGNHFIADYLYYLLSSSVVKNQFEMAARGSTVRNLNIELVANVQVSYPPVAEQHRIVAKLDAAFAEIDSMATITEKKLREVRKLYASGITEIYFSDKSVPVVPLSTISKIKGGKRLPKGKKLQVEPTSYPYIRVSDFTNFGTIDEKSVQYITEEIHSEISRYTISSEDVYVSIAGTIGKTGIIPQSLDGANLTENAAKIVLNEKCDKNYFYFFTTSSSFEKQAIAQTRTAAQPKLALERLGAVELPIHNKITQQAIAEKARDLRDSIKLVETLLNKKLSKIQALKSAILAQELKGEAA